MAIADLQRGLDRLDAHIALQGHGAEADLGNAGAMGFNKLHTISLRSHLNGSAAGPEECPVTAPCQPGVPGRLCWPRKAVAAKNSREFLEGAQNGHSLEGKLWPTLLTLE